ncbi:hypothetical protein [Cupriavidus sp. IK-TO18]|uniref:hypothetical protein n=1 Tax=Cupriavidus sp. IK-TO18 TaxID=2782182 RepID=UPI00189BB2A4|nr:hypothetical protein [Cupriavidus sp. IK-TO18]MBF6989609.1 hypothetical protein [Cupriavidus sp. IK-TO18]
MYSSLLLDRKVAAFAAISFSCGSEPEYMVSMIAFATMLPLGFLKGVIVAVLMSMLLLIRRVAHPRMASWAAFGVRASSPTWSVTPRTSPFPVELVRQVMRSRVRSGAGPVRLVNCDLSLSPVVDLADALMLLARHKEQQAAGAVLRLVGAHAPTRDMLRTEGMEKQLDRLERHLTGRTRSMFPGRHGCGHRTPLRRLRKQGKCAGRQQKSIKRCSRCSGCRERTSHEQGRQT